MSRPLPDLIRRKRALEKTMAKYGEKPFDWAGANCGALLRSHLVAMGHKRLPKLPTYATAIEAKRALKEMGFADMAALLDSLMPRIPASRALLSDVVLMGGLGGLDTVTIATGGGKVFSWHQDSMNKGAVVVDPDEIKGAWRA